MKTKSLLAASLLATNAVASILQPLEQQPIQEEELYLVETEPGETQWITEEQKWELKRVSLLPLGVLHTVVASVLYNSREVFMPLLPEFMRCSGSCYSLMMTTFCLSKELRIHIARI